MGDIGPFPTTWYTDNQGDFEVLPWFPLPGNLINNGQEWIPEIQQEATVISSALEINYRLNQIF